MATCILIARRELSSGGDPYSARINTELDTIHTAVFLDSLEWSVYPVEFENYDITDWFRLLSNNAAVKAKPEWARRGTFVDGWGNPLHIKLSRTQAYESSGRVLVRVWSDGPNRRNQDGKGDDVELDRYFILIKK